MPEPGTAGYASAPSNIALVKYWGKQRGQRQMPTNPSVSMTLSDLRSWTKVTFRKGPRTGLEDRATKLLDEMCPWEGHYFEYESWNNFPTACGIASSASGFCALVGSVSDCLSLSEFLTQDHHRCWCEYWCRLGSGSSIRSLYGGFVSWEGTKAIEVNDTRFNGEIPDHYDLVVVFNPFPKSVGSTAGHEAAWSSPLHELRVEDATDTHRRVLSYLPQNRSPSDFSDLSKLTEHEFMLMHAVMMTADPPIRYMNDACLDFCKRFVRWRDEEKIEAMVTVDAGSNPHVIFHPEYEAPVRAFCERFNYVQLILNRSSASGMKLGDQKRTVPEVTFREKFVVLSGKRYSGKTWLSEQMDDSLVHLTISHSIKSAYADKHGLSLDGLMEDRTLKETHRPAMVRFMEEQRRDDPLVWIRRCWENRPPLGSEHTGYLVTDARRPCDLGFLERVGTVFHVRVEAPKGVRVERGWVESDTDRLDSETGLDDTTPDMTFTSPSSVVNVVQRVESFLDRDGHGYGKLILFGEHFVVQDRSPGVVVALPTKTTCRVEYLGDAELQVIDDRPAVKGYKEKKGTELIESTRLLFKEFRIQPYGWVVRFGGTLTCSSGIGSSAANCVALVRALSRFKTMTNEEINRLAYIGESVSHGSPSGIDNTASTYGGLIEFQSSCGTGDIYRDPIIRKILTAGSLRLVYASTGITASTSKVLKDVDGLRRKDTPRFREWIQRYKTIESNAVRAIENGELDRVGEAMNANHELLKTMGISCPELDEMVDAARKAGAVGAKLTGTGRGGMMVALAPDADTQQKILQAFHNMAWAIQVP